MEFGIEIIVGVILGISAAGLVCYFIFRRKEADFESRLKDADTQVANLESNLSETEKVKTSFENELKKTARQIGTLEKGLSDKITQVETLKDQLTEVSVSNENALKLLHLFELSSQLTAFALYSEVSRATHLGGENRKLYKEYETLYEKYEQNLEDYKEFREEVERKVKRRLVRTGIGATLSLIPGVGAFQLVADLAELTDFATGVAEEAADLDDVLSVVELSIDLRNLLEDFIDVRSIELLEPETSSNQDREKVRQEYQSVFKEVFAQNLAQENKEPDPSDFDNFLRAMIQRIDDFVKLIPDNGQRNALDRIVGNFGHYGIRLHSYDASRKARADRSLPAPKNRNRAN